MASMTVSLTVDHWPFGKTGGAVVNGNAAAPDVLPLILQRPWGHRSVARAIGIFLGWVARAWRGHGKGLACHPCRPQRVFTLPSGFLWGNMSAGESRGYGPQAQNGRTGVGNCGEIRNCHRGRPVGPDPTFPLSAIK
eukprot:gene11407-biopygen4856